ncbi:hypothetical protein Tco_1462116 [Tanacetum coccineum]
MFIAPPPMIIALEARNKNKYSEFHRDKGIIQMTAYTSGGKLKRISLVYHPWDDEIYNEGRSSHYSERKSQTTANSDGASANHSSPKDIRCQGSNTPRYPEKAIMLGGRLAKEGKRAMCEVLKSNLDVFAYKPEDMNGVPRTLSEHKLGVKEGTPSLLDKRKEDKN